MKIDVGLIRAGDRLRSVQPEKVAALADSIAEVGLLNPITVYRREVYDSGVPTEGFGIIAGAHRFEAVKSLGLAEIEATVVELSPNGRIIAECDENLMRAELSKAERAEFTARRKAAYEAEHPETAHGTNQHARSRKLCDSTPARFTADTAEKTGRSERSIQMDARRGSAIDPEVMEKVKQDPALKDNGKALDALAKTPREQQPAKLSELAAAPRRAVARTEVLDAEDAKEKWKNTLRRVWNAASAQWRAEMLEELLDTEAPVFDSTRCGR